MAERPDSASDTLLQRQRQEIKDLRAKIQSMKKSVPKGDKKRKKEVTAETSRLEQELKEKHEEEMRSMEASDVGNKLSEGVGAGGGEEKDEGLVKVDDEDKPVKKSRAQKRKEKKAQQELERQRVREEEEEEREMALVDNPRLRERENLESLLSTLQLTIIDIQPDGNCLYAAIKDQLQRRLEIESSVARLRDQCAEYVRSHPNDFMPFTTNPKTGSLLSNDQFAQYCSDIENTASWGGELEIRALSHVYHVTITVYQAESPPVVVGEEYSNSHTSLSLSYHHHEYGLGEHYNSLAPISR